MKGSCLIYVFFSILCLIKVTGEENTMLQCEVIDCIGIRKDNPIDILKIILINMILKCLCSGSLALTVSEVVSTYCF